ncbi:MAG: hypothetical protein B7Y05_25080, partial [Polynucleobacter sp. 24-46-87]
GLLPLIVTWLNQHWESNTAGLWYPTIFLASGALVAMIYLPETKKIRLHHQRRCKRKAGTFFFWFLDL